jgi:hypothetical protein
MRSTIHSPSAGNGAKLARRSSKHFGSQPDALGLATRLAAGRLREAGKLGMSSRTLARRLMAKGLSFGEILNQLRSDLANGSVVFRSLRSRGSLVFKELAHFRTAASDGPALTPKACEPNCWRVISAVLVAHDVSAALARVMKVAPAELFQNFLTHSSKRSFESRDAPGRRGLEGPPDCDVLTLLEGRNQEAASPGWRDKKIL